MTGFDMTYGIKLRLFDKNLTQTTFRWEGSDQELEYIKSAAKQHGFSFRKYQTKKMGTTINLKRIEQNR